MLWLKIEEISQTKAVLRLNKEVIMQNTGRWMSEGISVTERIGYLCEDYLYYYFNLDMAFISMISICSSNQEEEQSDLNLFLLRGAYAIQQDYSNDP